MWVGFRRAWCKMTAELVLLCSVSVSHTHSLAHWSDWAAACVCVSVCVCARTHPDLFVQWSVRPCGCCFRVTAGVGLNGPVQEAGPSPPSPPPRCQYGCCHITTRSRWANRGWYSLTVMDRRRRLRLPLCAAANGSFSVWNGAKVKKITHFFPPWDWFKFSLQPTAELHSL